VRTADVTAPRRSSWRLAEGEPIAPGLLALGRLGGGRAYEAYLTWSERPHAHVVAKVVRPDQVADPHTRRGLAREMAMLHRLAHPVVVRALCISTSSPGPPADVWGLAVTLYEACSGRLPFERVEGRGAHRHVQHWPQLHDEPAPLPRSVPAAVAAPVRACLDRDPARRPTAAELAGALEPLVAALPRPVLGGVRLRR